MNATPALVRARDESAAGPSRPPPRSVARLPRPRRRLLRRTPAPCGCRRATHFRPGDSLRPTLAAPPPPSAPARARRGPRPRTAHASAAPPAPGAPGEQPATCRRAGTVPDHADQREPHRRAERLADGAPDHRHVVPQTRGRELADVFRLSKNPDLPGAKQVIRTRAAGAARGQPLRPPG